MNMQIACLVLAVSSATAQEFVKIEKFKAAGCADANRVELNYENINVCEKQSNGDYKKVTCTSPNQISQVYTDKTCNTAKSGVTAVQTPLACTQSGNVWVKLTCNSAPAKTLTVTKYDSSTCSTVAFTKKYPLDLCMVKQEETESGWAAGSTKYSMVGAVTNTTGFNIIEYSNDDCTGAASKTSVMGSKCSTLGDGFYTDVKADAAAGSDSASNASLSKRSVVSSAVAALMCAVLALTCF